MHAVDWAPSLQGLLEHYLDRTRPSLLGKANSKSLWIAKGGQPLSSASIRAMLQRIMTSLFSEQVTPKRIQEAWLQQFLNDHPNDILTPASHLTRNPLTVHSRKERIEKRSAVDRIDECLQGGVGK